MSSVSRYPVDPLILQINGVDWTGWTSCEFTAQVDAIAASFSVTATDPWADGARVLPIAAGMECQIFIDKPVQANRLLTGYIDKVSPSFSASDHGVTISGRSKSADMVDCSAVQQPGHWIGLDVFQLGTELAKPFGITVQKLPGADMGAPFPSFKLEQGETAFEAFNRALKQREILACSSSNGGIFLLEAGAFESTTALVQGENILSASADFDLTDRFSHYLAQGQQPGNDDVYGLAACAVAGNARDAAVTRYRPLIIRPSSNVDAAGARQYAAWESTVRAARSVTVSVTVQGFRQADGSFWSENALTEVDIPYLYLRQKLLISKRTFRQDAQGGSLTVLELKDPKAFTPEPKTQASGAGSAKDAPIEAEKDLQTRFAEDAAKQQSQIKEGK